MVDVKTRPSEINQEKSGIANNNTILLKLSEIDNIKPLLFTFSLASNEVLIGEIKPNSTPNPNKQKQSPINVNQSLIKRRIIMNKSLIIASTSDSSETLYETTFATILLPIIKPIPNNPIKLPVIALLN